MTALKPQHRFASHCYWDVKGSWHYRLNVIFVALFIATSALAQITQGSNISPVQLDPALFPFREIARLPPVLAEASGLEITKNGFLWSHNDEGVPALYCLDTDGKLIRALHINASNKGWEDLTVDPSGNMYIGSFGNNKNDRKDLKIFKITNPEELNESVVIPDLIRFSYADQRTFPPDEANRNFDVDAFFAWNNSLYLFTKDRSITAHRFSKVYRLTQAPGTQIAVLIDSLIIGHGPMMSSWITSADISPDGKTLALLFHDRVWFIRDFDGNEFSSGKKFELRLNHYSHKAGISFMTNTVIYIVDELELGLLGGKLYSLDITQLEE